MRQETVPGVGAESMGVRNLRGDEATGGPGIRGWTAGTG